MHVLLEPIDFLLFSRPDLEKASFIFISTMADCFDCIYMRLFDSNTTRVFV